MSLPHLFGVWKLRFSLRYRRCAQRVMGVRGREEPTLAGEITRRDDTDDTLDLMTFEVGLLSAVERLGLPVDQILVPVGHRQRVFQQVPGVLEELDEVKRADAAYLSKFMAAVAAGLFDAALNYLWDETIRAVRRRAADYDLNYFFDQAAEPGSDLRGKLHTADDMKLIDDQKLLVAANRIGLITDLGHRQLDLVRFMRNHASAAHPNQSELRATQLISYLDTCITEVINPDDSESVIHVRRLLANIKSSAIDPAHAAEMAVPFDNLIQDQADNLGMGFFGIYTRPGAETFVLANIRLLLPALWVQISEEVRKQFGVKAYRFRINHQAAEADLAREFLETVDGLSYLPDDARVPLIDGALDAVLSAHRGWSNFAAEGLPAQDLVRLLGDGYSVPRSIQEKYVTVIVYVFLTNGYGVSWAANPVYEELISNFNTREATFALNTITNTTVANRLHQPLSQAKFGELLQLIDGKIVSGARRALFEALRRMDPDAWQGAGRKTSVQRLLSEAKRVKNATRL